MKSLLLLTTVSAIFILSACGDPKPAQYPPSLYKDHEGLLTDEELAETQRKAAEKKKAEEASSAEDEDHSMDDEME